MVLFQQKLKHFVDLKILICVDTARRMSQTSLTGREFGDEHHHRVQDQRRTTHVKTIMVTLSNNYY